jgi:hypothetical protein
MLKAAILKAIVYRDSLGESADSIAVESLTRLESMEAALIEVYEQSGVELAALKKMAFVPLFEPAADLLDSVIVAEYIEMFCGLIR